MNQGNNQNEFENFLKEHAEEHRLFASDSVWKNIYRHVHLKGKIQLVILILLMVSTAITFKIQTNQTSFENRRITSQLEEFHPTIKGWENQFNFNTNTHNMIQDHSEMFVTIDKKNKPIVISSTEMHLYPTPTQSSFYNNTIVNYNSQNSSLVKDQSISNFDKNQTKNNLPPQEILFNSAKTPQLAEITIKDINELVFTKELPATQPVEIEKINIAEKIKKSRKERISWQLSAMPTASFRKLSEVSKQEGRVLSNFPFISNNPEELVRHTPAIGLELGVHMLYKLNDKFRIKSGLQMNYSKYDINAYSTGQVEPVRIELDGFPSRTHYTYSNFRNFGGEKPEQITNQYFQLAIPVGLEFTFFKKDNFELTAAGTIQPNYLLNANSYLISADFKNYAKAPDLIRKFNASTSGEVFVSYSTGQTRWQVGPVIRYQLKSSFIKEYPIREHIIEYGFKIAVTNIIP